MTDYARPPRHISAHDFFVRWVPDSVARDESRRSQLGATRARIVFHLEGEGGGDFTLHIEDAAVAGAAGGIDDPDLRVQVDVATWRSLNAGEISAPEAILRRRLRLQGDFVLGLKLHLILGRSDGSGP